MGAQAEIVTVEALFEPADRDRTEVVLTGLPDVVLRESRGRLLCALEESGLRLARGRLFLNLAPAGLRKSGEILDLPLALAAAAASGHVDARSLERALYLGELGIDGALHGVPGGLAAAAAAAEARIPELVAPAATAAEAACQPGVRAFPAARLGEVVGHAARRARGEPGLLAAIEHPDPPPAEVGAPEALDAIRGQAAGKQALAVAAAGGHALLFTGPPGTGKTLLARALVGLLPPPSFEERLAITRVLSAAGRWPGGLARRRPFRAPHHTVSFAGLVGGGAPPSPGEITLAHGGVLFLDELPEFRREALEALRQPLESGAITISRAGKQLELPARFQLVAAMNPCPCGYLGHPRIPCKCDPGSLARYRAHISGPLYDRIDLRVEVPPPSVDELALDGRRARADGTGGTGGTGGPQPDDATAPSAEGRALARRAPFGPRGSELAATVAAARERARERQGERFNAALSADELDRWMPLDGPARRLVEVAAEKRGLSARAVQSVRRVARTCADLEHSSAVEARHVAQALALRA